MFRAISSLRRIKTPIIQARTLANSAHDLWWGPTENKSPTEEEVTSKRELDSVQKEESDVYIALPGIKKGQFVHYKIKMKGIVSSESPKVADAKVMLLREGKLFVSHSGKMVVEPTVPQGVTLAPEISDVGEEQKHSGDLWWGPVAEVRTQKSPPEIEEVIRNSIYALDSVSDVYIAMPDTKKKQFARYKVERKGIVASDTPKVADATVMFLRDLSDSKSFNSYLAEMMQPTVPRGVTLAPEISDAGIEQNASATARKISIEQEERASAADRRREETLKELAATEIRVKRLEEWRKNE